MITAEDRARVKQALDAEKRAEVDKEETKRRASHKAYEAAAKERHRVRIEKAARERARVIVAREGAIIAKCEECPNEFTTKYWWKRFCSSACRWKAKGRRKRARAAAL